MDNDIIRAYRQKALIANNQDTRRSRQEPMPLAEKPVPEDAAIIRLPEPDLLDDHEVSFLELIECRATIREYKDTPLTMKELSYLLWCTQGVKMMPSPYVTRRNVPSAGARHAFETYLYIDRVEGLRPGLYRFLALGHVLMEIDVSDGIKEKLGEAFYHRPAFENSAITFIWAADYQRMEYQFGVRSLQYLFIDAGHVCQNLYLSAYTIGTGVCAAGAFDDELLNSALKIDGDNDFAVYAAHAGKM